MYEIPMESSPTGARNACGWGRQKLRFTTGPDIRVWDGALAEEYAVSSTFKSDASRKLSRDKVAAQHATV